MGGSDNVQATKPTRAPEYTETRVMVSMRTALRFTMGRCVEMRWVRWGNRVAWKLGGEEWQLALRTRRGMAAWESTQSGGHLFTTCPSVHICCTTTGFFFLSSFFSFFIQIEQRKTNVHVSPPLIRGAAFLCELPRLLISRNTEWRIDISVQSWVRCFPHSMGRIAMIDRTCTHTCTSAYRKAECFCYLGNSDRRRV